MGVGSSCWLLFNLRVSVAYNGRCSETESGLCGNKSDGVGLENGWLVVKDMEKSA